MADAWREFWERPNRLYAGRRHLEAHCRVVADALLRTLDRPGLRVLDDGCGEALDAARVAAACGTLYLYDASSPVRANLERRFAGAANIVVLDDTARAALGPGTLDRVFVSSVVQYLDAAALDAMLAGHFRLLVPGGRSIVADVIGPGSGLAADVAALLSFARREGFLGAALAGLAATFFSDYRRLRRTAGLASYDDAAFLARLAAAGFAGERLPRNLGEHPGRRSYAAVKPIAAG